MYPHLSDLIGFELIPGVPLDTHSVFVAIALLLGSVVFWIEARRRERLNERTGVLVVGALAGAAVFARLGTWAQHLDPRENLGLAEQLAYGNASFLSALVGAWLGVHVAKKIIGYKARSGDLFAPAVALAMAFGRWACYLTERPGTPTGSDWGVVLNEQQGAHLHTPAGVGLHPSFAYESAFHLIAFCVLWFWLRFKPIAPGETLTLYIGTYAVFRFFVEFVRGNEIAWMGLTRPQMFLLVTIPIFAIRIIYLIKRGKLWVTETSRDATAAPRLAAVHDAAAEHAHGHVTQPALEGETTRVAAPVHAGNRAPEENEVPA
ncbi:prolipoprotein diacylglyceryl transferase [Pseudoglutamicibacter albus]|uniref:prolipoprotein diacylglyceryl transferase n=1 Tax=Pseudoglutamicibacter albus TaxID=98671 RepID=UPI001EF42D27|nr:prolipoprotein diacylglyceryl transferase family protein [Pseudoglutamicibacter albus]MCG7303924.1 prolipoprotein diacylglyceryl transferase [Pseudoglutamicibacter albus]